MEQKSKNSNRIARVPVNPETFLKFFMSTREMCLLKIQGIPEGAQFRGFSQDWEKNQINLFVEHESFDDIPPGQITPELIVTVTRKDVQDV